MWIGSNDAKRTTREVFSTIYLKNMWGSESGFSSGTGSENAEITDPYVEAIRAWATEHNGKEFSALGLGCGDFRVGGRIHAFFKHCIGGDIVRELIDHHRSNYRNPNVEFVCIDAIEDDIPDADVVLVRQVLQHLSNEQIGKIIAKLKGCRHLIVTEHVPAPGMLLAKNSDKAQGGGIRVSKGSGVYLEAPPFCLEPAESRILVQVPGGPNPAKDGVIVTTWYRMG